MLGCAELMQVTSSAKGCGGRAFGPIAAAQLDILIKKKAAFHLEPRLEAMIDEAFFQVRCGPASAAPPPPSRPSCFPKIRPARQLERVQGRR